MPSRSIGWEKTTFASGIRIWRNAAFIAHPRHLRSERRKTLSLLRASASTHPPLGDVFSNDPDSLGLGNYEVVVEDVVRQLLDLHLFEARVFEHLFRLLLAPHRAQALPALRQGDGHAVHSGDGVEERSDGVVEVIVDVAGARDVLHQVDPVIFKGVGYTLKPRPWLCLVVDRIEGGDQVV